MYFLYFILIVSDLELLKKYKFKNYINSLLDTRDIKLIEIVLTIIIDTDIDLLESIYIIIL